MMLRGPQNKQYALQKSSYCPSEASLETREDIWTEGGRGLIDEMLLVLVAVMP